MIESKREKLQSTVGLFVSLSEGERALLSQAGSSADQSARGRAVAVALAKTGDDHTEARRILGESFAATAQPSFHLIPRGDVMASEGAFDAAYAVLSASTEDFSNVSLESLTSAVHENGAALAPLRMIIGFTHNELASAIRQAKPDTRVSAMPLRQLSVVCRRPETLRFQDAVS